MKSPFFEGLFEKDFDLSKDKIVLDFFKGWLSKHDQVLLNFFNNALKANKTFIEEQLIKMTIPNQYRYLNSEISNLKLLIKKSPIHCKILFKKIGQVDKLYDVKHILDLVSLIHYPFLEVYFGIIDYNRNNLKEEHFQDAETALEIIELTSKLLNEFATDDKKMNLDFYYLDSENLTGLASYFVFLGCCIQIYYRLKPIKEDLVQKHPNLKLEQNQENQVKKKPNLRENLIDKLPSEWRHKPFSEYFSSFLQKNFPEEYKTSELEAVIEQRKIKQKIRGLKQSEKISFLNSEIKRTSDFLNSPDLQQSVSLFKLTMEEYFINLNLELELAYLIKDNDSYIRSKDEVVRSEELIKTIRLLEEIPLFNSDDRLDKETSFRDNLNYVDKWIINPRISGFLKLKSMVDKKEFLHDLLNGLQVEENNKENIKKMENFCNNTAIQDFHNELPNQVLNSNEETIKLVKINKTFIKCISIQKDIIDDLYNILKKHFQEEVHNVLLGLLNGKISEQKICFKGALRSFVYVFFELKKNGFILDTKLELENWLCSNFCYSDLQMSNIRELKLDYIHKIISSQNPKEPKNKIVISNLLDK